MQETCLDESLRVFVASLSSSVFLFLLFWFAAEFEDRWTNLLSALKCRPDPAKGRYRGKLFSTTFFIIYFFHISKFKTRNIPVDWFPLFWACLAASCLVFMSVNSLSESAFGILSKKKKNVLFLNKQSQLSFEIV